MYFALFAQKRKTVPYGTLCVLNVMLLFPKELMKGAPTLATTFFLKLYLAIAKSLGCRCCMINGLNVTCINVALQIAAGILGNKKRD